MYLKTESSGVIRNGRIVESWLIVDGRYVYYQVGHKWKLKGGQHLKVKIDGFSTSRSCYITRDTVALQITLNCTDCENCEKRLKFVLQRLAQHPDWKHYYGTDGAYILGSLQKVGSAEALRRLSEFLSLEVTLDRRSWQRVPTCVKPCENAAETLQERLQLKREEAERKVHELEKIDRLWWCVKREFRVFSVVKREHENGRGVSLYMEASQARIEEIKASHKQPFFHRVVHFQGRAYPIQYVRPGLNRNCIVFVIHKHDDPASPVWELYSDISIPVP